MADKDLEVESVTDFRQRARRWIEINMPKLDPQFGSDRRDDSWDRQRILQQRLWRGGFAGICFPRDYGGKGLSVEHQRAFNEEALGYELPVRLNVPTLGILAATLLECGSHEQKSKHLPAILAGEELWVQLLSEPSGGSDLAGCLTKADRDGDVWILSGSKIWSSAAKDCDYGMCLARTNWDVPKHRGLTMFIVRIHQPDVVVEPIRQVNGSLDFCQEFFDDVILSDDAIIGDVNAGWTVATRLLAHERMAAGGGSPYASGNPVGSVRGDIRTLPVVRGSELTPGADEDLRVAQGQLRLLELVEKALVERVTQGMRAGVLSPSAGALLKLFSGTEMAERSDLILSVAGTEGVVWKSDDPEYRPPGERFISRQSRAIAGGTNEMQRNVISERILGMPREWAADRDVPFREVQRNILPSSSR